MVLAILLASGASAALAGRGGTERPFKGTVAGQAIFLLSNPKSCPEADVTTTWVAVGTVTHLGKASVSGSHCPSYIRDEITDADATFVAANGDTLKATYAFASVLQEPTGLGTPLRIRYEMTFTGGTGRFAGATGRTTFDLNATFLGLDVFEWPAVWTFSGGTITY